jgi:hypothetical protein
LPAQYIPKLKNINKTKIKIRLLSIFFTTLKLLEDEFVGGDGGDDWEKEAVSIKKFSTLDVEYLKIAPFL